MSVCRICDNAQDNEQFVAREMMFGFRDEFRYFKCRKCGCLQIDDMPHDMSRFYPANYYSFTATASSVQRPGWLKRILKARRLDRWLGRSTLVGSAASAWFGAPVIAEPVLLEIRENSALAADMAILDVGCGRGQRLLEWASFGFRDLTGYDPFLSEGRRYPNGVNIVRDAGALTRRYEVVMLNHSFEHMAEPIATLRWLAGLLAPEHVLMIALPLCSSFAFQRYGPNWVQWDAPRHFYLHTPDSMAILAERAGLAIDKVVYNSTAFQFWGSEQYERDIALTDDRSFARNPAQSMFSTDQIAAYTDRAEDLNRERQGDQASFYLRRK